MKVHFKIVCVVLVVLCLVAQNESWWKRKSRSSRRSSSSSSGSSRRSSSSSSRHRSSSSRSSRRSRGWFIRRPKPQVKPRTKSSGNCQWRYGLGYLGCKKTASKTTTAPRKVSTPASACITQLKNEYRAPSVIIRIFLKKPQICKKLLSAIRDAFLESTSFRQPSIPQEVKRKYVKKLVTVERPLNTKKKGKYGKDVITFLNNRGIKTSISRNPTTITHSGVLVTTEDGKTYLIHKTKKDKTRVEYRPNLLDDPDWKAVKTIKPKKRLTINDYFNSTEPKKYFFWTNNCHHATERMVQLAS